MKEIQTQEQAFSHGKCFTALMFSIPSIPQTQQILSLLSLLKDDHNEKLECFYIDATDLNQLKINWPFLEISAYPTVVLYTNEKKECGRITGANAPAVVKLIEGNILGEKKTPPEPTTTTTTTPSDDTLSPQQKTRLKSLVESYPVFLFIKGSKSDPFCRFSKKAVAFLNDLSVDYETFDVFRDATVREDMKRYSDWPTYPQLYVDGKFIGGVDIMEELLKSGELESIVKNYICNDINTKLKMLINKQPIMIFMKGNQSSPFCKFSRELMEIFNMCGITDFGTYDILQDNDVREGLKVYSSWPTYPQIYVKGKLLGGVDIVKQLIEQGGGAQGLINEIQSMLAS